MIKTIFTAFMTLALLENPMADIQQLDKAHAELWGGEVYSTQQLICDDMEHLENRNGEVIIERIVSQVLDGEAGDGLILGTTPYYLAYEPGKFETGDRVVSYCLYNPETNYYDDIIERYDYLLS